jgi:hypothetical protein
MFYLKKDETNPVASKWLFSLWPPRGLLGRRSLQPDSGVWIVPADAVHTIEMLFTFDLVLVDKNFKVVGVRELVRPLHYYQAEFQG